MKALLTELGELLARKDPHAPWRPEWVPFGADGSGGLLVAGLPVDPVTRYDQRCPFL